VVEVSSEVDLAEFALVHFFELAGHILLPDFVMGDLGDSAICARLSLVFFRGFVAGGR
jgi:hypothetical protein